MMGFIIAVKAFLKALQRPDEAQKFIDGRCQKKQSCQEKDSSAEQAHLRLLAILQQSGRLVDFLKEDISHFSDSQVGVAARKIHDDCNKSLEDIVTIRPVMEEKEGTIIQVARGYDANMIKLVGKVKGEPPYSGVLVHKGWKAHKRSLPKKMGEQADVICPAEVEVK